MAADPVLIAYTAKRTRAGKVIWTEIGRAYPHEQGNGLNLLLDSVPLHGRVILLEPNDDDLDRHIRRHQPKSKRRAISK